MESKNITKKILINKIYQNLGFSKNFTSKIVDNFFDIISSELIKFKKIKVSSFGTMQVVSKKEIGNLKRKLTNSKKKTEKMQTAYDEDDVESAESFLNSFAKNK